MDPPAFQRAERQRKENPSAMDKTVDPNAVSIA